MLKWHQSSTINTQLKEDFSILEMLQNYSGISSVSFYINCMALKSKYTSDLSAAALTVIFYSAHEKNVFLQNMVHTRIWEEKKRREQLQDCSHFLFCKIFGENWLVKKKQKTVF